MGRGGAKKDIPIFLDSIKDEHYENFQEKTYVIKEDKKLGMRLDHQGVRLKLSGCPTLELLLIFN